MFPAEIRDSAMFVAIAPEPAWSRSLTDVTVETTTNRRVQSLFGMAGHTNLGLPDSLRLSAIGKTLTTQKFSIDIY